MTRRSMTRLAVFALLAFAEQSVLAHAAEDSADQLVDEFLHRASQARATSLTHGADLDAATLGKTGGVSSATLAPRAGLMRPALPLHAQQLAISPRAATASHKEDMALATSSRPHRKVVAFAAAGQNVRPEVAQKEVGSAGLDWPNLGFTYRSTNGHVKLVFRDGAGWSAPEFVEGDQVSMHVAATALHYGQACFEGLKAHAQPDGSVALFRPQANAERMTQSCNRIRMPSLSEEKFLDACKEVVRRNWEYVPPYGSGGALYLRPVLFGTGARIGVEPAAEYTFLLLAIPVGDYYKGGMGTPIPVEIMDNYDRAAPRGVGAAKVGGNYAADLVPNKISKERGYTACLYLDAATQTYVEEFSTSNFIGISKDGSTFLTPSSPAILGSVTNKCLQELAADIGLKVEKRPIHFKELEDLSEAAAVGTAVVITPVGSIQKQDTQYTFGDGTAAGPVTSKLYKMMRDIQTGDGPDPHGWRVTVPKP